MADQNTIKVTVDDSGAMNLAVLAPALGVAMERATHYLQMRWIEAAQRGIGGLAPTSDPSYAIGIEAGFEYPFEESFLKGRVVNYSPTAQRVEEGFAAFDMKPGLLHGSQARRAKDGTLFNIVPFRWGTPRQSPSEAGKGDQRATLKSMPEEIYDIVRTFTTSKRTGSYFVPSVHDDQPRALRQVYEYEWGQRLKRGDIPAQFAGVRQPWHKASQYEGMYHFQAGEGTRQTHSTYITFRAVSEKSDPQSWIHPGVEGKPYSKAVIEAEAQNVRELIQDIVTNAMGGTP